jgi:hypothetical protein
MAALVRRQEHRVVSFAERRVRGLEKLRNRTIGFSLRKYPLYVSRAPWC